MSTTSHPIDLIITDPDIRDGAPVLRGTQTTVAEVVRLYEAQRGAVYDVADQLRMPLDYVHAALAFYHANRSRVDLSSGASPSNSSETTHRYTLHMASAGERLRLLYRELRSPLTALAGQLELLEKRAEFGDDRETTIDRLLVDAQTSLRYIRDLIANAAHTGPQDAQAHVEVDIDADVPPYDED